MAWFRKASALRVGSGSDEGNGGKALLFAGLVSTLIKAQADAEEF